MVYPDDLVAYLKKINSGKISKPELREFIEACLKIGAGYLHKRYQKHKKSFAINGISFLDVAVDSITPLFIKEKKADSTGIQKTLLNWHREITSYSDAAFFLHKLIYKRVDQTVNKILSELDPVFGKLLNNVMYYSRIDGVKRIYYFGLAYLVEKNINQINGSVINEKEFNNIPVELFRNKTDVVIKSLFQYIRTGTNHFAAIPLNIFVLRLKHLYVNGFNFSEFKEDNNESLFFISQIFDESLIKINTLIETNYVLREKLTAAEGENFKKAIKDISFDMRDGGINRGLDEYMIPYFKDFSSIEGKEKFYNILDYLYRLLRKDIKNSLEQSKFS